MALSMNVTYTDGAARAGEITTARGTIQTPVFMPVGTRAAVKTLDTDDLERLGPPIVLANTYHLMDRPGADLIEECGGLHKFMDWDGHMLTDSGGYQIFSLEPKITEESAVFKSVYDGRKLELSPEKSVKVQEQLGADIAMVLDVCTALPATREKIQADMQRTHRWAERSREAHTRKDQNQFGIVQGGVDPELREISAKAIVDIGFDGYAIGGLSVGESREDMVPALRAATQHLPGDKPRYFMGLGDPIGLIEAVHNGVDMFDCVLPTRLARHGTALTNAGRLNLKNAQFAKDLNPIDPTFDHALSARYSRAYLRHLLITNESTGGRILTLHNLAWLAALTERMRSAIIAGTFDQLRDEVWAQWHQ